MARLGGFRFKGSGGHEERADCSRSAHGVVIEKHLAGVRVDALGEPYKQIPRLNRVQVDLRSMFNAPYVGKTTGDGTLGAFVLLCDS